MRLLFRHSMREAVAHGVIGLMVFTFVLLIPQLVRLMELVVRQSAPLEDMGVLVACTLPGVLTFALPMSVLVGILISLGRMSSDGELVALRATGTSVRRMLSPVMAFGTAGALLTLAMTIWLGPAAARRFSDLEAKFRASQAGYEIQPRVFEERFPSFILYLQDVERGGTHWKGIFLADTSARDPSRITLAEQAVVVNEPTTGRLQLHLAGGASHEYSDREPERYQISTFSISDLAISVGSGTTAGQRARRLPEFGLQELWHQRRGAAWRAASVELYRRFAFPGACLVFALVALPLGAHAHKAGRALGFVLTLLLISVYYLIFILGVGAARQGQIPPAWGVWLANAAFTLVALLGLAGMERVPREESWWEELEEKWLSVRRFLRRLRRRRALAAARGSSLAAYQPAVGFPWLIDLYIVQSFLYPFVILLLGFVVLFNTFTFFELLDDIGKHQISWVVVASYLLYLTPRWVYLATPLSAMVAMLVSFGGLMRSNEITAMRSSGISLYRVSVPILLCCGALAAGLFALDSTYLPYANRRQDALRNLIKGRPPQTYLRPERRWIFGQGNRIYNYRLFDPDANLFGDLNVYELDPRTFQLARRIYASRAHWEAGMEAWIMERGWVRDFEGAEVRSYRNFSRDTFSELAEPPAYFKKEVRESSQMNWWQLENYINDLKQAGFDTTRLTVQWHKKFAFPILTVIIVLLGVPFSFSAGRRGALGGVALGLLLAIFYWSISGLFEAMGAVGQLPALLGAWSADLIFLFGGLYLFLRMPT